MLEFEDDMGAAETAVSYTDQFVDAAVAKLDAVFGQGYAKDNPAALAGYVAACASNLEAFMTAASAMPDDMIAEAMSALEDLDAFDNPKSPLPPKKKRGR
jgi:hypothetical protein